MMPSRRVIRQELVVEFDFATNTSVQDIEKIPQDFRGLYRKVDDKFVLDTENESTKSAVSAVTRLNQALKAARAEAKAKPATVDLAPLKDYGTDPVAIAAEIKKKMEGLEGQIKGVNIEKIKQDLATEFSGKMTAAQERAKALENQLYQELVVSRATGAIAGEKADPDILMPFVQKVVKVAEKDGKIAVHVVDDAGDIRYSGVTGAPMSINELVKEMKANKKYASLFPSEAPNGGGTTPASTNRKTTSTTVSTAAKRDELSPTQKIAAGLTKGQARRA